MGLEDLVDAWNSDVGDRARKDIDSWHGAREAALPALRDLIDRFLTGQLSVSAFRTAIDSFVKSEPHWGFKGTALMFFTQLVKAAEPDRLTTALRDALPPPHDEDGARAKIGAFRDFVIEARDRAAELGRTRPQVGRINFFLSFFWEAQEREAWPIYFPNSRDVLSREGALDLVGSSADKYVAYRRVMLELAERVGTTWKAEALLWQIGRHEEEPPAPVAAALPDEAESNLYAAYRGYGLIFPDEVITSLVLSLLTKRFLILSGISGTGKTKLAQVLAEHLEALMSETETVPVIPNDDEHAIHLKVTAARLERGMLYPRQAQEEFLKVPARGEHHTYAVALPTGGTGTVRVTNINFADETRHLMRLSFGGAAREWFVSLQPGSFVAVELDAEGGIAALRHVATEVEEAATPKRRHALIPVKSDWTDSRGLLGYDNPLTGSYVVTPLIQLLLDAVADPTRPYLAILDEMNLARVEYYFSDFLSALESGDEIPLRPARDDDDDVPAGLAVPRNLTFIGTVNVDETTHAFSPKVLDRANVIEFNTVDVDQALEGDAVAEPSPFRLKSDVTPSWFVDEEGRSAAAKRRAVEESSFTGWLTDVHGLLARDHLHFGYRVIDEVSAFVGHAVQLVQGEREEVLRTAFDLQLVQKIVPKFAGGRELEEPLARLLLYCLEPEVGLSATPSEVLERAETALSQGPGPMFPRAARKLSRMLRTLQRVGFVAALQ